MEVLGVAWRPVRAVLRLAHPCTSRTLLPCLTELSFLPLSSGFLRWLCVRHGSACPRVLATRCLAPHGRARTPSASVQGSELPGLTVSPRGARARREDAQLLQLHVQLRGGHAQRHHPGHQRRVHPGRPLPPAVVLCGQGHLLRPAARAQRLRVGLLPRCAPDPPVGVQS